MKVFMSKGTVSGRTVGHATVTEDGGFARNYGSLTEVLTKTGHITDAYYFVEASNAEKFVCTLNIGQTNVT